MSPVAATKTLMTAEEFYEWSLLPENESRCYEFVRGEVVESPLPKRIPGAVCGNIARILGNFTFQCHFGYITTNDAGVILERDPDTVRGPDVAIFDDATTFAELHPAYGEVPPILAVEVITTDTKVKLLDAKIDDYLDNGVKIVWVVDPDSETVRVYRPDMRAVTFKSEQDLEGGDVLPGFRCKVADFFVLSGKAPAKPTV